MGNALYCISVFLILIWIGYFALKANAFFIDLSPESLNTRKCLIKIWCEKHSAAV
jgi:hypothetical protein